MGITLNRRAAVLLMAATALGGATGVAGSWALLGSRVEKLDQDLAILDARSATVARLDAARVKQCLDWSASWQYMLDHGEHNESEIVSTQMANENCGEVMDAIRRVRSTTG